jgi:transposase
VFTVRAGDAKGRPVWRRNLRRREMVPFFTKLPPVEVVMEACGGSHHWARTLQTLGHTVRLLPPQYVTPFVKRGKNDNNDADAINDAADRPGIHDVPVKSADTQARAMLLSVRELLVRQRTQMVNALRGHAAEMGLVAPKGPAGLAKLRAEIAEDASLPEPAREALHMLGQEIDRLEADLAKADKRLLLQHKADATSQRLAQIPGVGPISALSLALCVDAKQFESGRHFAAWLGLAPREKSTGGKQRMGGISRAGNERLRMLLVVGATSVVKTVKPGGKNASAWLLKLLERKPKKLAAVALANKMARIVWAMLTSGEAYRRTTPVAA